MRPGFVETGWYAYDYEGGLGGGNVFYPAVVTVEGGEPVFSVNDSQWRNDTPEDPDSILALLRYQQWLGTYTEPLTSTGSPMDLRGRTVEFELRADGLDLKGGHATFWFLTTRGQRWHYYGDWPEIAEGSWTAFSVLCLADDTANWHLSWEFDPSGTTDDLNLAMASVNSYGVAFIGYSEEPTGQLDMRHWLFT